MLQEYILVLTLGGYSEGDNDVWCGWKNVLLLYLVDLIMYSFLNK